ncbi:MAG: peptidylprolyl isomerase [Candidatus Omnitrophica bacterium]|nr:peptidylprolyl isomerase [Candidatus Omnitrophota bacterium]
MRKKTGFLIAGVFAFSLFGARACPAEVIDKILVVVNDEIITQGEVDRILRPIYLQYKSSYSEEEFGDKFATARRNVLNTLINDKLLLSEAKRRKIEVTDEELNERIDKVKKDFASEEEFKEALAHEKLLLSEFKRKHKERLMIDMLIDGEIKGKISISPTEVAEYYQKHRNEFKEPRKIRLRSILIRINAKRTPEEAAELAKRMLARLEEGGDFGLLAKEYSEDSYAESGGDMGWVTEGELMDRINDFIFNLDKNETSGILTTNLGLHIFKVEDKVPASVNNFDEAREKIERVLYMKKVDAKLKQWLARLKENAYIAFK